MPPHLCPSVVVTARSRSWPCTFQTEFERLAKTTCAQSQVVLQICWTISCQYIDLQTSCSRACAFQDPAEVSKPSWPIGATASNGYSFFSGLGMFDCPVCSQSGGASVRKDKLPSRRTTSSKTHPQTSQHRKIMEQVRQVTRGAHQAQKGAFAQHSVHCITPTSCIRTLH